MLQKLFGFDATKHSVKTEITDGITIIIMPLAYSISEGILCGMISYVAINALCGKFRKLNVPMCILAVLFVLKYIFI